MANDGKQLLLKGQGYSGRGVRIALLTSSQLDTIREEAAKAMPKDDDLPAEARQTMWVNGQKKAGIAAMVVEVTEQGGFTSKDALVSAKWKRPTVDELTSAPDKYFTTKDLDALGDIFFKLHVAQKSEVDDILGEAQDVAVD